jgi:signal transduction histidine kinase
MSSTSSAKPSEPPGVSPSQADFFGKLVGVRSSKQTYYREYRHTAESLDRSIRSLEPIAEALTTLTRGPQALVEAVLRAVFGIFDSDWALVAVDHPAFGTQRPYIVEASSAGTVSQLDSLPERISPRDGWGLPVRSPRDPLLVADLTWDDTRIGALAVRLTHGSVPDETDAAILQTLGHQAVTAIQNAWLYAESERLRDEASCAYDEMAAYARRVDERNRQLREARTALAKAREQQLVAAERARIARGLHDTVAQHVLSIGMNVEWCRARIEGSGDQALTDRLVAAKELARTTIEHIRESIFELSAVGEPMPGGLVAALERLVCSPDSGTGPAMSLRVAGTPVDLPELVARELYLIAREALFNVTIHADASRAEVVLGFTGDRVRLSVTDDGVGNAEALRRELRRTYRREQNGYHRGLANMRHRARELGSDLKISQAPGGGLRVSVTVRLDEPAKVVHRD